LFGLVRRLSLRFCLDEKNQRKSKSAQIMTISVISVLSIQFSTADQRNERIGASQKDET